jgi:hypothetical protein
MVCCPVRSPPPEGPLTRITCTVRPRKPARGRCPSGTLPRASHVTELVNTPRPRFRVRIWPGTTPAANDPATALQRGRGTQPIPGRTRSYLRDTPRLKRLSSTDLLSNSGLPTPARSSRSQVSGGLRRVGHVASGAFPTEPCAVCPGLPPGHSFRRILRRFQQPEEGSCRLPLDTGLSRFGTVSHTTYRQALTGLSWLSYSRPRFSGVPDSGQRIGSACRQVGGSPRRPRLNEPDGTSTRVAVGNGCGPDPLGGICTLLDHHGLACARWFLVAPLSCEGKSIG